MQRRGLAASPARDVPVSPSKMIQEHSKAGNSYQIIQAARSNADTEELQGNVMISRNRAIKWQMNFTIRNCKVMNMKSITPNAQAERRALDQQLLVFKEISETSQRAL